MISLKLIVYLSIGTVFMFIPVIIQSIWYKFNLFKAALVTVILTVVGTIGTYILFFIENHWIGGTSFYGAVFFTPIAFIIVALLLRTPYGVLVDLCAPAECVMLSIMKVQCLLSGCCAGREILVAGDRIVRFPSQIAEMINAILLLVLLMILARRTRFKGLLYPIYMIAYGASRFILNFLRESNSNFALGMSAGHFWSILSVFVGISWLLIIKSKIRNKRIDVS